MRRTLQALAVCAALLLAAHMMAQDTGGGGGADSSGGSTDNSGGSSGSDNSGGGNTNGGAMGGGAAPAGGTGDQSQGGTGAGAPGNGELPAGGGTEGTGQGSSIAPPSPAASPSPGAAAPVPTPSPTPSPLNGNTTTQGSLQTAPVTFTLPGTYGNASSQSFTLGQGRLSKPPITFTTTISQGFDSNIFSADADLKPTPTPIPEPTPPLEERFTGVFRISPPSPPTPIFQIFRPKALPTPSPVVPLGVIGSPVSTLSLGVQVQEGSPRTLLTMDLSVGAQDYWDQPGKSTDYTGSFDLTAVHRISPRATVSLEATAVYQNTPDFSLLNAPTNTGNGGSYLNGSFKGDLTYAWSSRISTVTSAEVDFNLLQTNASSNLYQFTYGTQFRYAVSARNSVTAELRQSSTVYPTNSTANNSGLFYLLGLDTFFSSKLRNTIDGGFEVQSYSGGGASQTIPYMETATTLALPRQGTLSWTNRFGSEETGNSTQTSTSYRTGVTLSQPISTKLVASFTLAYNFVTTKDATNSAGAVTQTQVQAAFSLGYTLSPRLSLSLSYTYIDLLTTTINSSYTRDQIFLGGTYTFR
jgi:hypothetical protein